MSIVLKCDVCGSTYDYGTEKPENITFFAYDDDGNSRRLSSYDICPDCYKAIAKTLDGRKAIANRTEDDLK
jgi:hypothetical protein